jgi:uncharacterized protein involved in response to NO
MFSCPVYSLQMKQTALLNLLLVTLIVEAGFLLIANDVSSRPGMAWRIGFFILMPLALAVLIWLQLRWAAMVVVIYATVGLAMDLATLVQAVEKDSDGIASLLASGVSGLFYLSLIVFGGRVFLNVEPEPTPPKSRPPNPPSPS